MFRGTPARSSAMTMAEVAARLAEREAVTGLLLIGSGSGERLAPASDYDLVVVLTSMPAALAPYGVTYIDGRLTDLLFVTTAQLDEIAALVEPVGDQLWLGRIIRWFETGEILFDRTGQLAAVQAKVRETAWIRPPAEDGREQWRGINYNFAQSKRLLQSTDPVYLLAADLRLALYGAADLLFGYFAIRRIPWAGEKAAVRYLLAHDPAYLDRLRQFIDAGRREDKFALYEELVQQTIAPVGEIWPVGITALALKEGAHSPDETAAALALWERLLGE